MNNEQYYIEKYLKLNPNELSSEQMILLKDNINHPKEGLVSDEYLDFYLWQEEKPSRQELFANYIEEELKIDKHKQILEVGCGINARLSQILTQKGYSMTCIDPQLNMHKPECFQKIKDKFDYRTYELSHYDFVVGQEPCDATEHIVRACFQQKIPFVIILCGVPHQLINGYMPKDVWEWYQELVDITCGEAKLQMTDMYLYAQSALLSYYQKYM